MINNSDAKCQAIDLVNKYIGNKYGSIVSVKPIHNGYTNFSYLVEYQSGNKFQARIPHCGELINRITEKQILDMLGDKSFLYFDSKTGNAIKLWIEGKCPTIKKHRKWLFIDDLFTQIKKIHLLDKPKEGKFKKIDFDAYNDNLYHLKFKYQTKFLSIIDSYADDPLVVSHTDINAQNLILDTKGKVHIIDFEWCALSSDYWDYANFIRESGITWYEKIEWNKYINKFDLRKLKDYIFASAVFAYLWTWKMPQTSKIKRYRRITLKQIQRCARGVFDNEK